MYLYSETTGNHFPGRKKTKYNRKFSSIVDKNFCLEHELNARDANISLSAKIEPFQG